MNLKKLSNVKVSAMAVVLSVGILSGYSALNKQVTLVVKGEERTVSTFSSNVGDLLEAQNISYDGNDIVNLDVNSKLSNGDKIEVIDVKEKTVVETKDIPFEVTVVEDNSLTKGDSKVKEEGKSGKSELVYKETYHNGKKVEKEFVKKVVTSEPVNKVVNKGTKVEMQVASSRGESSRRMASSSSSSSSSNNGRSMRVVATAYSGHTITATGTKPKWGTIAVDPKVIPYGTKVYIPQFDMVFTAEDCGGAIKGNKIDIFMNDSKTVYNWGRKTIDIRILK
ncbi:G5 domain-containing protein [Clostridioides difficile]|nr:G5 domain-containing protein [Clostridioides difficile]